MASERGILFSAPMVRALLAGTKTQTRRIVKHVAGIGPVTEFQRSDTRGYDWIMRDGRMLWNDLKHADLIACCPFGVVGDQLWVREKWCFAHPEYHSEKEGLSLGDRPVVDGRWCHYAATDSVDSNDDRSPWCSSIHMPRWASRITLEITDVRVQRVQDISMSDVVAEGFKACEQFEGSFSQAWDSTYGEGAWERNDWVWALTFRRVDNGK